MAPTRTIGAPRAGTREDATDPTTIGAHLREARRRNRISIERAAEETRIRADFLMRMESDEFDFLAPAYVRGFLRSYARFLGLEPEPLLAEFDRRFGPPRADTSRIVEIERRAARARPPVRLGSWGAAALIAAVMFAGLAVIGLVAGPDEEPLRRRGGVAQGVAATTPAPPSPTPEPTPSPTPGDFIASSDGITVVIEAARADCWVEVTADGVVVFSQTIPAGSSETFEASEQMSLRLGFPEGIDLIVNGRDLGTPGGPNPITLVLPDDIEELL